MMTRRDNMMAILNHQSHDHIGSFMDYGSVGGDSEAFENGPAGGSGGKDWVGMEWSRTASGFGGGTPAPGKIILPDITEWKKYVHFPDITKYDWEGQAKAQMPGVNKKEQVIVYGCWNGPFLRLVDMMSMVEGLVAFYEEPEACEELLTAITDYRINTLEYIKKYFDPDVVTLYDDFAHERDLFISPEIYRSLISPQHKRFADAVKSYGMIPNKHVCGKPEAVVPDFVDEGYAAWEIAQPENDLVKLGKICGDKLAFIGGLDMQAKWINPNVPVTDDDLRARVHECIDKYGPAGNYGMFTMIANPSVDFVHGMMVLHEEVINYGTGYYCK